MTTPIAQKNTDVVATKVGDGEIRSAILVEVSDDRAGRPAPRRVVDGILKGSVAIANQHTCVVAVEIGDSEIPSPLKSPTVMPNGPPPAA